MGARTLFTTMHEAGELAYDDVDREMFGINHDGAEEEEAMVMSSGRLGSHPVRQLHPHIAGLHPD